MNDRQVQKTLFVEAAPKIYFIFIYYVMNKAGIDITFAHLIFRERDVVMILDLNYNGRPFYVVGLTTYEILSQNGINSLINCRSSRNFLLSAR